MRKIFDEELAELYKGITEMGELVNTAVKKSVASFIKHDVELANEVIKEDQYINSAEIRLEKASFTTIALQQPVAADLRKVVAVMKVASDLERIGDHAVSIAEATIHVKGNKRILEIEKMLDDMSDIVQNMLKRILRAYVSLDNEEARQVAEADEAVDIYLKKIGEATIKGIRENPDAATGGMEYVLVAGYLERMGDYITNLCERIVYISTGKITELN